jgi:hypothetical protein
VDGNATSRVFRIAFGKTVAISSLTIANGNAGTGYYAGGTSAVFSCSILCHTQNLFVVIRIAFLSRHNFGNPLCA